MKNLMIRTVKINKVGKALPQTPGFISFDCANWFSTNVSQGIPLYEVSPYHLRNTDGCLMENIWQGAKIYPTVTAQNIVYNGRTTWSYPTEHHIINGQIQPEYWNWRRTLMFNSQPVRYPNGFHGRHQCKGSVWYDEVEGTWKIYGYIEARKKIYGKLYASLVKSTQAYMLLKQLLDSGQNIQICEIDVRDGIVNRDILLTELHNTSASFGHGYVLAACLLGCEDIF